MNIITEPILGGQLGHQKAKKFIHLLYVPTIYCNLGCHYCYLGKQTDTDTLKADSDRSVETLRYAIDYFGNENILPFNLSLHGGEVTSIPRQTMTELFLIIAEHYLHNYDELMANGFRKQTPHIKTNLYNFDKYQALFDHHKVSISGSVDLPLSLHKKYRTTKTNKSTLDKIIKNIKLLSDYPHGKKLSATLFSEHFNHTQSIIDDIWFIHRELGFDMNNFNFMFGFESLLNTDKFSDSITLNTTSLDEQLQIDFYQAMKREFVGTELEWGFKRNWFDEFTPSYCTSAKNCGERFFLLQSNGDVFSCVRGQGSTPFKYGNIFVDSASEVLQNAVHNIRSIHQDKGLHDDCEQCEYLNICNTGCAYVKHEKDVKKSYTCALQKQIYKDYPHQFKAAPSDEVRQLNLNNYVAEIHPNSIDKISSAQRMPANIMRLSSDFYDEKNTLANVINNDALLQVLYTNNGFALEVNGEFGFLTSQLLKTNKEQHFIEPGDKIFIHVKKELFEFNCADIVTNTLHLQLLRDSKVVYGDEMREKQEHIFTQQVFYKQLMPSERGEQWLKIDLSPILELWSTQFIDGVMNNFFVTTSALREYHYKKQQKNAFYHIQAVNLPFQNFEFFWCK